MAADRKPFGWDPLGAADLFALDLRPEDEPIPPGPLGELPHAIRGEGLRGTTREETGRRMAQGRGYSDREVDAAIVLLQRSRLLARCSWGAGAQAANVHRYAAH